MSKNITTVTLTERINFYDDDRYGAPAFCVGGVNRVFPATAGAPAVLLEVSATAFKGSKRFVFSYKALTTSLRRHEILPDTTNWLQEQGFRFGNFIYIKFSPA